MDPMLAAAHKAIAALEESIEFNGVPDWSPSIERRREAIQALRRALMTSWAPEGWRLVPVVPTRSMHQAHDDTWRAVDRCWAPLPAVTERAWKEMLRAAPVVAPRALGVDPNDAAATGTEAANPCSPITRPEQARVIVRRVQVGLSRLR